MIPKMKPAKNVAYKVCAHPEGSLLIEGFSPALFKDSFCLFAAGSRYHDYGIADHSLLLCDAALEPKDGDLVIGFRGEQPLIYLYRPRSAEVADGAKRIMNDPDKVDAVVLSSFNFFR